MNRAAENRRNANYLNKRYEWFSLGKAPSLFDEVNPSHRNTGRDLLDVWKKRTSDSDEEDDDDETSTSSLGISGGGGYTEVYESRYEGTDRHEIVLLDRFAPVRPPRRSVKPRQRSIDAYKPDYNDDDLPIQIVVKRDTSLDWNNKIDSDRSL